MIILGITAFEENPAACLVVDGKLLNFCHEERFIRLKGAYGHFPSIAIKWCLKSRNLSLEDVNEIAFYWGCNKYPLKMLLHLAKIQFFVNPLFQHTSSIKTRSTFADTWEYLHLHTPKNIIHRIYTNLRADGFKGKLPKIRFVNHHICHAYQSYYQSPFKDAAVLVIDGSGEENCVSGYSVCNGEFNKVISYDLPNSLGWFFAGFTAYLGFRPNKCEGKLMGLAALGEQRKNTNPWLERIDSILRVTKYGYEINPTYFKFGNNEFHYKFTEKLVKFISSFDPNLLPVGINEKITINNVQKNKYFSNGYIDLAYAVQTRLEEVIAKIAQILIDKTKINNLCLSGGVAMNCKANGYIYDNTSVQNIFVHPASSDDGACIGAAFFVAKDHGYNPRNILKDVQLGPSFTNNEIENILKKCNLSYSKPDDICMELAEYLSRKKIAGWFNGGCEMGARALGGRSIVACPIDPEMKSKINNNVKFRESWRPYCPSILNESKHEYLEDSFETPYMILARRAKDKLNKFAPATVHVDNSVRPQTVNQDIQPKWYHLLKCMEKYTGHPIVLNTSFNISGEPIVCSPYNAIKTFFATGLDLLAIGDFLVKK